MKFLFAVLSTVFSVSSFAALIPFPEKAVPAGFLDEKTFVSTKNGKDAAEVYLTHVDSLHSEKIASVPGLIDQATVRGEYLFISLQQEKRPSGRWKDESRFIRLNLLTREQRSANTRSFYDEGRSDFAAISDSEILVLHDVVLDLRTWDREMGFVILDFDAAIPSHRKILTHFDGCGTLPRREREACEAFNEFTWNSLSPGSFHAEKNGKFVDVIMSNRDLLYGRATCYWARIDLETFAVIPVPADLGDCEVGATSVNKNHIVYQVPKAVRGEVNVLSLYVRTPLNGETYLAPDALASTGSINYDVDGYSYNGSEETIWVHYPYLAYDSECTSVFKKYSLAVPTKSDRLFPVESFDENRCEVQAGSSIVSFGLTPAKKRYFIYSNPSVLRVHE